MGNHIYAGMRHLIPLWRQQGLAQGHIRFPWIQEATFELGALAPNPTGFDALGGTDQSTLAVNAAAALRGALGFSVGIPNTNTRYGIFNDPSNETVVLVEYLFDPNSIVMAAGNRFLLCFAAGSGPTGLAFRHVLDNAGGVLSFEVGAIRDDGTGANFTIPIADEPLLVSTEWQAASAPGADDGILCFKINNAIISEITTLDNDQHDVDALHIGATFGVDVGTIGTILFDNVRWARRFING